MSKLTDELAELGILPAPGAAEQASTPPPAAAGGDAWPVGDDASSGEGPTLVLEHRVPLGSAGLPKDRSRWAAPVGDDLAKLSRGRTAAPRSLDEALFLDVESTGLGAGTHVYAFLVGLGRLEGDAFVVRQYFLRAPEWEAALITALAEDLAAPDLLVTFNGRSFDLPLLETQFLLQQKLPPFSGKPHLDIMGPARRIWRYRLGSCTLTSLERELFDLERVGDIPGREIPGLYLEYLRSGEPAPLLPVLEHNLQDIVSLAALSFRLAETIAIGTGGEGEPALPPDDYFGLGRCFEALRDPDRALQAYEAASEDHTRACRARSVLLKRRDEWEAGRALWTRLLERPHVHGLWPYEELAKQLEHRDHHFDEALALVDRALEHLELDRADTQRPTDVALDELEHRRERLQRKVERGRPPKSAGR